MDPHEFRVINTRLSYCCSPVTLLFDPKYRLFFFFFFRRKGFFCSAMWESNFKYPHSQSTICLKDYHQLTSTDMASSSPVPRSQSRASCFTATTYHSFQDVEMRESEYQSQSTCISTATGLGPVHMNGEAVRRSRPARRDDLDKHPAAFTMVRQDSGYESGAATRTSSSTKRHRNSSKQSSSSPSRSDRASKRPGLRRSGASNPVSHTPGRSSLTMNRPTFLTPQQQQNLNRKNSYFQFPAPENLEQEQDQSSRPSVDLAPVILKVNTANLNTETNQSPDTSAARHRAWSNSPVSPFAVPPPTTHYWTSDRTRQLEYAAIDAASKGVRGWIMRNMVPDCFVPRDTRRAGFEDDGGSVRRYRIDLEIECPEDSVPPSPVGEKLTGFRARGAKRSWWSRLRGCT